MPSPAGAPLVRLSGLSKSVPGGRRLFEGLELRLEPGEFVAVMGESGVGKSTLLNLIGGLDVADAGEVEIEGVALSRLTDDARTRLRRDRIGFVFQAFHILPHLTLAQNIALPLVLQRRPAAEALARAREMLAAVGLDGRAEDYPQQLSGGELQRIAIARALAHRPAVILADEPTGNLDPETAEKVLALFEGEVRRAGAGAILVTHSEAAAAAADRVLRLTSRGLEARDDG
ncbi:ABC transporter ATP-binding protein [Phenylobacterium terrae]|uniref:ABC transporter ATP-binding protein n=1 Tax=Phenylobacterium terrae TaxID=2665495 RepID=A0ABW4MXM9_9CAUL